MHIAIIGCGQLSRMMALAGIPYGFKFSFINDTGEQDTPCVNGLGSIHSWEKSQPIAELYKALGQPDCITVEKEQMDVELLRAFADHCDTFPPANAVAACQHRQQEKTLLERLGIPTSPFTFNTSAADTQQSISLPLVAKSCTEGYDGKNQWVLDTEEQAIAFDKEVFDSGDESNQDFIIEKKIPFQCEVSQVSVRGKDGSIAHYPLTENQHGGGILKQSIAPANDPEGTLGKLAQEYISKLMIELDYVGVLAMECFVDEGSLLINELAPRVHNSGHWTQSGSDTSQFENHIRAIAGLTLGSTQMNGVAGMVNLIGIDYPSLESIGENAKLHWYNKSVRPGRKLGHVNLIDKDYDGLLAQMAKMTF